MDQVSFHHCPSSLFVYNAFLLHSSSFESICSLYKANQAKQQIVTMPYKMASTELSCAFKMPRPKKAKGLYEYRRWGKIRWAKYLWFQRHQFSRNYFRIALAITTHYLV